jgi:hypothetical protein
MRTYGPGRESNAEQVVATINLSLIDRGFVLHRRAHGKKGAVRCPMVPVQNRSVKAGGNYESERQGFA